MQAEKESEIVLGEKRVGLNGVVSVVEEPYATGQPEMMVMPEQITTMSGPVDHGAGGP